MNQRERFPILGNLCLIDALRKKGVKIFVIEERGEVIANFSSNQTPEYECLKKILLRRALAASA